MAAAAGAPTGDASDPIVRIRCVRTILVRVVGIELLVLAITGVYLVVAYRPAPRQAWPDLDASGASAAATWSQRLSDLHALTSWIAIATALLLATVLLAEGVLRWSGPRRRRRAVVVGPVALGIVLVAALTGTVLDWQQLALDAVTVGTDVRGMGRVFGGGVAFVIVDGMQVDTATFRAWVVLHVLVLPLALLSCLVTAGGLRRRRSAPRPPALGGDRQDVVVAAKPEVGAH